MITGNLRHGGISIIVCCYNSAGRIDATLQHLATLEVPQNVEVEIILVDNGCTDDTAAVARDCWSRAGRETAITFAIVREPSPGLTNARLKGVKESRGSVLLFCDDDNHLFDDYLVQATRILDRDPSIAIVGGLPLPVFSTEGREWIKDFYGAIAIGDESRKSEYTSWVFGAGMVIKRDVFDTLAARGIRILLSDRKGNMHTSGGDAEICCLARFMGFKIYYSAEMRLYHDVPKNRLGKSYYRFRKMYVVDELIKMFILDHLVDTKKAASYQVLYRKMLRSSVVELGYYGPRMILGGHRFYSFCVFYQRLQTIGWILFKRKHFYDSYAAIRSNLSMRVQRSMTKHSNN